MIIEDYVSFETAKLLKERGFGAYVSSFYDGEGKFSRKEADWNWNIGPRYSAPTLQMAMKWLREVHNLHINLDIHWLHFINSSGWIYIIDKIVENGVEYIDSKGDENDKTIYLTYEKAAEAAIKYCLENLI